MYKGFVPDSFGYEKVDSFSGSDGQTFILLRLKSSKVKINTQGSWGRRKREEKQKEKETSDCSVNKLVDGQGNINKLYYEYINCIYCVF